MNPVPAAARRCLLPALLVGGLIWAPVSPQLMAQVSIQPAPAPALDDTPPSPAIALPLPARSGRLEDWRSSMSRALMPNSGCFKASYPSTEWQQVQCTAAPPYPYPFARGSRANTVGNGTDSAAQVSGLISTAVGSFESVTGVTSESDSTGANDFSLQINANTFTTSVCNGAANRSTCQGWQQFVYSNGGLAYMQYWLLDYGPTCPTGGWLQTPLSPNDCYANSAAASVPVQPITDLAQLSLTGSAVSGGSDTVILSTGSDMYSAQGEDSFLNLAQGWQVAEFNVFGDCCLYEAAFNIGSTVIVRTGVENGTTNAPSCVTSGFTGETNNLIMIQPCCPYGGASPAIEFMESNAAGATSTCGRAPTVTTGAATAVTSSNATLHGTVNPNGADTMYWFFYGTNSSLDGAWQTGLYDIGSGTAPLPVSAPAPRLTGGTLYYYQLQASNSVGTSQGSIMSFTTLASQTITFDPLPNQVLGAAPFPVSATASSGLPVTFSSVTTSVCTVSGSQVTLVAVGTCTIQATQAGDTNWATAMPVSQSFLVMPPSLGANALLVGSAAGSSSVVLTDDGAWTATANDSFLHISAGSAGGTGSAVVVFTYDAFAGTGTRTGTLTIAGLTVIVTQAGTNYIGPGPVITLVSSGLNSPGGVAVDGSGNVYIADTDNDAIKEWSASTQQVTTLVSSGVIQPWGVAADSSGNVYIADTGNNAIKEWIASSQQATTLVSSGLNFPWDVAVDASGNVYIAENPIRAIEEWSASTQQVTTLASSGLSGPYGVAVDGSGNVYIADAGNNDFAIREWSASTQQVTTLVSSGLNYPWGVAVDGSGNVYIADTNNNAIKEIPYAFVGPASLTEPGSAGSDSLLPVLPSTASLTGIFAPTSDQSWLTIGTIADGVISFSFTANTSGSARVAHITVLGQQITITQDFTSAQFADIPPSATFFDAANLMFQANVTTGCEQSTNPQTRLYCPDDNVTRQEMAAFIVRAVTGTVNPAIYNTTPYFQDVPNTNPFFPHIQKMMDLGITTGCSQNPPEFCPTDTIPRWEMAIFMIRARLMLYGATFTTSSTPYFADVPTNVEGNGQPFPFIQRSFEEHITNGCGGGVYCPDELVTRGQMASFIMRGLFNRTMVIGPTAPYLAGATPNAVAASTGSQITVTITGANTNFQGGDTVAVPSGMLDVSNVVVNSATSITATLTVNRTAVAGPQALVVTTGGQNLTLPLAIKVGTY